MEFFLAVAHSGEVEFVAELARPFPQPLDSQLWGLTQERSHGAGEVARTDGLRFLAETLANRSCGLERQRCASHRLTDCDQPGTRGLRVIARISTGSIEPTLTSVCASRAVVPVSF